LLPRADTDLDVETVAAPWRVAALASAREHVQASAPARTTVTPLRALRAPIAWHRERPFSAEVLANQRISASGSVKDIRHIELSLRDSGLTYEPGDSLGVWASNPPQLVAAILDIARLDGQTIVSHDGETLPLRDWLIEKRELTRLTRPFVLAHVRRARDASLDAIVADPALLQPLLATHQVIDVLQAYPAAWDAAELIAALRPLAPRLYSIASSAKVAEDEAHLTVARVAYDFRGHARVGAASHFLATREEQSRAPVYVETNDRFRLPGDASRDVIMIGPGTGVAPFRAFVQEREAIGARGRNWLFFGNPHFRTDFLYQLEWQAALKRGTCAATQCTWPKTCTRGCATSSSSTAAGTPKTPTRTWHNSPASGVIAATCTDGAVSRRRHQGGQPPFARHARSERRRSGDGRDRRR
jgi:sulfite reductase (NADPH) flavoprotein alpha-component